MSVLPDASRRCAAVGVLRYSALMALTSAILRIERDLGFDPLLQLLGRGWRGQHAGLRQPCLTSGRSSARLISPLSRSMIGRGVCGGAASPSHDISWMPGTVSTMRRRIRHQRIALRRRHRERPQLAVADARDRRGRGIDHGVEPAADHVGEGGDRTAIGHRGHLDAGAVLDPFSEQVIDAAAADDGVVHLAGRGAGPIDQVLEAC